MSASDDELPEQSDRDEIWSRFAEQGLFDDPIRVRGFVSKRGRGVERVEDDA
jgi:hypothetical protein